MKEIGMKLNGWYLYTPKVDYFFETEQKKKTQKFLIDVATKMVEYNNVPVDTNIKELAELIKTRIQRSTYQAKISDKYGLCHCINSIEGQWSSGDFEKNKHCSIVSLEY